MTPTMKLLMKIVMVGAFSHLYHEEEEMVTIYNVEGSVTVKQIVFQQLMDAISNQSSFESHGMSYEMANMLNLF